MFFESRGRPNIYKELKVSNNYMLDRIQQEYVGGLLQKYEGPTHETNHFEGLGLENFVVLEGVLAPEKSAISPLIARFLFEHRELYENSDVLELGSGSGILAIMMAKYGAKRVVTTDILDVCVRNTQENAQRLGLDSILEARQGDLFECVDEAFDLIVFNHPFFYGNPIEGNPLSVALLDEGNLIRRFLSEAKKYLRPNGRIIMPFSEIAKGGNDPKIYVAEYGFTIRELASFDTETGKKFIYKLIPRS